MWKNKKIEPKLIDTISIVNKLDHDLMANQSSKSLQNKQYESSI